jgi:hypothetical protein
MDIVKRNSSSPFQLQRSMVDQGGSGGAYESGGYNPEAVYNNDVANATIESLGKVVGAALSSRTAADNNASDLKTKSRLDKKEKEIRDNSWKNLSNDKTKQRERSQNKLDRIDRRQEKVEGRISEYNKSTNPFSTSISLDIKNPTKTEVSASDNKKSKASILFDPKTQSKTSYSDNSNLQAPKKEENWKSKLKYLVK